MKLLAILALLMTGALASLPTAQAQGAAAERFQPADLFLEAVGFGHVGGDRVGVVTATPT